MQIILASASPRRRQLLKELLPSFEIIPADTDETAPEGSPQDVASHIALKKAECVLTQFPDAFVIGADTIVVLDGEIFGKPRNKAEAADMLVRLSGRTHEVFTGVALLYGKEKTVFCERSEVTFKKLTNYEIEAYISTGAPFDKAGGYGIQDSGFVENIDGSYSNVMGFPVEKTKQVLQKMEGVSWQLLI